MNSGESSSGNVVPTAPAGTGQKRKFGRVVLHVGAPKCGSTAIQAYFNTFRDVLLADGLVAYPPGLWHAPLASSLEHVCGIDDDSHSSDNVGSNTGDNYLIELHEWLENAPFCSNLLLSYEGFSGLGVKILTKLRNFALEYSDSVTVLFYVRGPVAFARSGISQGAKHGLKIEDVNFIPLYPAKEHIGHAMEVFGRENITVRAFSPLTLEQGDVVADFCAFLGIEPIGGAGKRKLENVSLSYHGMLFAKAIRHRLESDGYVLKEHDFHRLIGVKAEMIPGSKYHLEPARVEILRKYWKEHGQFIEEKFGINVDDFDTISGDGEGFPKYASEIVESMVEPYFDLLRAHLPADAKIGAALAGRCRNERLISELSVRGATVVRRGGFAKFSVEFSLFAPLPELEARMHIYDSTDRLVFGTSSNMLHKKLTDLEPGKYILFYEFLADLSSDVFTIGFAMSRSEGDVVEEIYWCKAQHQFRVATGRAVEKFSVGNAPLPASISILHV